MPPISKIVAAARRLALKEAAKSLEKIPVKLGSKLYGDRELLHLSERPDLLMSRGFNPRYSGGNRGAENWSKPRGLFWAESPDSLAYFTEHTDPWLEWPYNEPIRGRFVKGAKVGELPWEDYQEIHSRLVNNASNTGILTPERYAESRLTGLLRQRMGAVRLNPSELNYPEVVQLSPMQIRAQWLNRLKLLGVAPFLGAESE